MVPPLRTGRPGWPVSLSERAFFSFMGQLSVQLSGTAPPAALLAAMKSCIAATRARS